MDKKPVQKNNKPAESFYYLTLFKVAGHDTYRAVIKHEIDGLDKEIKTQKNYPEITERKVFRISKAKGTITAI